MNYFEKEHELWKHLRATAEITPYVITIVQIVKLQLSHPKKMFHILCDLKV
jgi:hypothetical protein